MQVDESSPPGGQRNVAKAKARGVKGKTADARIEVDPGDGPYRALDGVLSPSEGASAVGPSLFSALRC